MKKIYQLAYLTFLLAPTVVFAGNEDRIGQAGAQELLINPWGRTAGWGNSGTSTVRGVEGLFSNVAGTVFTRRTELCMSRTMWLQGTGINISSFGLSTTIGKKDSIGKSVISVGVTSVNYGDILVTTSELPEGGQGTLSPRHTNIAFGYARRFSPTITAGMTVRMLTQSVSNVSTSGVAMDAGILYVTENNKYRFGVTLKNVGPRLRYKGDGLSFKAFNQNGTYKYTVENRSEDFDLPTVLNIGAAYKADLAKEHALTFAFNFQANAFGKDQITGGLEYAFKDVLMLRAGYDYEKGITNMVTRTTALTGLSAGASFLVPLSKSGLNLGIDYGYRATNPFSGCHTLGLRLNL